MKRGKCNSRLKDERADLIDARWGDGSWITVHHGKYFTPPEKAQRLDVPVTQGNNTPISAQSRESFATTTSTTATNPNTESRADLDPITAPVSTTSSNSALEGIVGKLTGLTGLSGMTGLEDLVKTTKKKNEGKPGETPFWCYGFLFEGKVLYLSDTSFVPTRTWDRLYKAVGGDDQGRRGAQDVGNGSDGTTGVQPRLLPFSHDLPDLPEGKIQTFILDCLRIQDHSSHLSYVQALALAMKAKARETLLVGFTHPDPHALWEDIGRVVQGQGEDLGTDIISTGQQEDEDEDERELRAAKREFRRKIEKSAKDQGLEHVWREALEWKGFVQPAFDRQVVRCD
jgi:hypothetical protein